MSTTISSTTQAFEILHHPAVEAAVYAPEESQEILSLLGRPDNGGSPQLTAILAALANLRARLLDAATPETARLWEELRDAGDTFRGSFVEQLQATPATQLEAAIERVRELADREDSGLKALRPVLREHDLILAVAGDFKRGKSTLINALLGKRILPTRVAPATAVPCILRAGAQARAQVYFAGRAEPESIAIEDIERYACIVLPGDEEDNLAFQPDVEQVVIDLPVGIPADVTLIDLPGLNEEPGRARTVQTVLRRADAVIVVLAATQLLAENEQQFIETLWAQGYRALTFVVNFTDGLEEHELQTVRERCATLLGPFGGVLGESILLLSARRALRAQLEGKTVPESTGIPALKRRLESSVLQNMNMIWHVSRLRQVLDHLDTAEDETGLEAIRLQERTWQLQAGLDSIGNRLHKAHRIYAEGDAATAHDIAMRRQRISDHDATFDSRWATFANDVRERFKRENLPWIWQKAREWLRDDLIQAIREVNPQVTPRPEGYLRISVAPGLRVGREALLEFYLREAAREWERFTRASRQARRRELEEALAEAEREQKRLVESRGTSWAPLAAREEALRTEIEAAADDLATSVTSAIQAGERLQTVLTVMAEAL